MTLYEIDNTILLVIDSAIDPETGEILDETAAEALDRLELARDEKIENICLFIKDLKAEAEAIKAEKLNLAKRQQTAENRAEWLKNYLARALCGQTFKTARTAVSYRKSEVVEIAEGAKVPDDYLVFAEPKPNKTELKKALKAGQTFDGVSLVEKQNIQIK